MANNAVLSGTVALVTGASSGIGEATAKRLAADGATVAVAARRLDRLGRLAQGIRRPGGKSLAIESDITDRAAAEALVERTVSELGRLDTVVNNAGVMLLGPALGAPAEDWDTMIELNVQAHLYVTRAGLPRRVADVVMISSTAGRVARPGAGVYALTKFGVAAFAESLRQELISQHVRVSVVEPGTVDTELVSHNRDEVRAAAERQTAEIEPLHPDDIADAVAYIVTRDRRVAVNEVLVRAAEQTW